MKRALAALLLVAAPAIANADVTRAQHLMGTVCEITVPDGDAHVIDDAFAEAKRIENMISTWRDDTELARLNRGETHVVSFELRGLLINAMLWAKKSDNTFNPLVRPLIDVWGIRDKGAIPSKEALAAALKKTSLDNFETADSVLTLKNGAMFDEGGFGKGYAIDRMLGIMRRAGVTRVHINFGGQIGVYGEQPLVYIADPQHRDKPLVSLLLNRNSISTSSGSVKSFTVDGRTFTHIVDPRTGEALPPRGSVSVLDKSALWADIFSTALYVMGPEKGLQWARDHNTIAVFVTEDGKVLTSQALPHLEILKTEK